MPPPICFRKKTLNIPISHYFVYFSYLSGKSGTQKLVIWFFKVFPKIRRQFLTGRKVNFFLWVVAQNLQLCLSVTVKPKRPFASSVEKKTKTARDHCSPVFVLHFGGCYIFVFHWREKLNVTVSFITFVFPFSAKKTPSLKLPWF